MMTRWKTAAVVTLVCFGMACGHDATIDKTDGTFVDGIILSSERDALRVQLEYGTEQTLLRKDIVSVDYPGTGLLVAGAALIFAGLAMGGATTTNRDFALACLPFGLPGLGLFAWGSYNNLRSRRVARAFQARTNELEDLNQPITGPVPYRPAPRWNDPPAPATNLTPAPP
jgi:hypothetical protein